MSDFLKTCIKCKEFKHSSEFHANKRLKDGRHYYCKVCARSVGGKFRSLNPKKCSDWKKRWALANPDKALAGKYRWVNANPEKQKANQSKCQKKIRVKMKDLIFRKYSGSHDPFCKCCGETQMEFLTVDHIYGGGNKHRREISKTPGGRDLYYWIVKNNFPDGFQILCFNCNWAKGHSADGKCPHQTVSLRLVSKAG